MPAPVTGMVGADPEQLDQLGKCIVEAANALDRTRCHLGGRLRTTTWCGTDADRFRYDWDHRYAGMLVRLAEQLREQGHRVVGEGDQQRRASAADGGAGSCAPNGGRPGESVWATIDRALGENGWVKGHFEIPGQVTGVIGAAAMLVRKANVTGRYTNAWRSVIDVGKDLFRYKSSSMMQGLQRSGLLGLVAKAEKLPGVKRIGAALDVVGAVTNGYAIGSELAKGHWLGAADEAAHTGAALLKTSKNPVAYLGGVALETWTQVFEEAGKVDWSAGVPNPLNLNNLRNVWAPALKETGIEMVKRAGRIFG